MQPPLLGGIVGLLGECGRMKGKQSPNIVIIVLVVRTRGQCDEECPVGVNWA